MTVKEALDFFESSKIKKDLRALNHVALHLHGGGYVAGINDI